jgi:hypothetical protein
MPGDSNFSLSYCFSLPSLSFLSLSSPYSSYSLLPLLSSSLYPLHFYCYLTLSSIFFHCYLTLSSIFFPSSSSILFLHHPILFPPSVLFISSTRILNIDYDSQEVPKMLDPKDIRDVRNLRAGKLEHYRVKYELPYKGVSIMEVESQQQPPITKKSEKAKLDPVKRRILILGHVASDSGVMVSLQIENGTSWVSYGLDFSAQKTSTYPEVAWCKGLAVVHTAETPTSEATNRYRMEQATELMKYASNRAVEWKDLDLDAIKVCQHIRHD